MALDLRPNSRHYQRYFTRVSRFYQQKKVKTYTGIIASILAVTFFALAAIKPTLITIATLKKEIQDQEDVSRKLDAKITALTKAYESYNQIVQDKPIIEQALPPNPELSQLTKELEALAKRHSIGIASIQFEAVNLGQDQISSEEQSVNFVITASGKYLQLKEFLFSLDELRRVITVSQFAIRPNKKALTEANILSLVLTGQAHFTQ